MSTWRIDRHYGYGAGHVRVQAEPHGGTRSAIRDGVGTFFFEWTRGGVVATLRRTVTHTPAIMLGLFLIAVSAYTILRDYSDDSAIEVVMFGGGFRSHEPIEEPLPEPVLEEVPPPPIELAEVKPEPVKPPEPKPEPVVPKPAPPLPPPALAERPKPPPPPPAEVKPKPSPRPVPVIPQIAKVEPPKPPPVVRPDRPKRVQPKPIERPRVEIDQIAPKPSAPKPQIERIARAKIPLPQMPRNTPKLDSPAAPNLANAPPPPTKRAFRVAKASPTAGERPRAMPGLAPVPSRRATPTPPAASRPDRTAAARRSAARVPRVPQVAPPALAAARVPGPTPALPRGTRETRDLSRRSERNVPNPVAFASRAVPKPAPPPPKLASRTGRQVAGTALASADERPGVAGVPLGELAACMSDRDEDRLKQAVVAAVKTQEQCVSRKGTYRFVETKNLNAFLMWIDRAPSRAVEDRCAELRYALECLQAASQRAAR